MDTLLDFIEKVVGAKNILRGEDVRARPADWITKEPCLALALVRPANAEQLSQVMALCYEADQPVVTHGGLTGLVRGAVAASNELVISLERMILKNRIGRPCGRHFDRSGWGATSNRSRGCGANRDAICFGFRGTRVLYYRWQYCDECRWYKSYSLRHDA